MSGIRVVIVEPMYQVNLGQMARVLKNFGVSRMELVNPRCNWKGREAIKYSKHARELLEGARIWKSVGSAVKGSFVIGSTGVWEKSYSAFHNIYTPEKIANLVRKNRIGRVVLLIGRDGTGLTSDEISNCDAVLFIDADRRYPILNISHAMAIALNSLTKGTDGRSYPELGAFYPNVKELARAEKLMRLFVYSNGRIREKEKVLSALSHVLKRGNPTREELGAIAVAMAPTRRRRR